MLQVKNNCDTIKFVDISVLDLTDIYKTIKEKLIDYTWFVGFGTALGLYRDKQTIPKDTDIDICILEENQEKIEKIKSLFSSKHFEHIRTTLYDNKIQQFCFQRPDNLILDICFFYSNDDYFVNQSECGTFKDKKEVIGSLQFIKTKYGILPFPEQIENYLTDRYGDWKIPKYGLISSSLTQ